MHDPLNRSELDGYLARIGYEGTIGADLGTLTALHTAHLQSIPFENLDVQFGTPPTLDPAATYAKLVTHRSGGWCYEQNGLFGRALAALGFDVVRVSAGVMRQLRGDIAMGNHLTLLVRLDTEYLADVGFGGGLAKPVALVAAEHDTPPVASTLSQTDDGYWRLAVALGDPPLSYEFRPEPADEAHLARVCEWQGTHPDSLFMQNLVVQQRRSHEHVVLRGKVFTRTTTEGVQSLELDSGEELVSVLRDEFALDVPAAASLWDRIEARHTELFR